MSGCRPASLLCPVGCSSHVVFIQDFFPQSSECLGIFTKLKGIFQEFCQSGKSVKSSKGLYKGLPTPMYLSSCYAVEVSTSKQDRVSLSPLSVCTLCA